MSSFFSLFLKVFIQYSIILGDFWWVLVIRSLKVLVRFFSANFHCLFLQEDSLKWDSFLHRDENN